MTEPRRLGQTITEFERFLEATIRSGLRRSLLNSTDHQDAWLVDVRVEAHGKHSDATAVLVHDAGIYHSSEAPTAVAAFLRDLADEIDGGSLAVAPRQATPSNNAPTP